MRPRTRLLPALTAGWLLSPLAAGPAPAQTYTWSGQGADNNWSTAANWQGGVVPVSGASTAVILTGTASHIPPPNDIVTTMNLGGFSLNSLTFADGARPFFVSQSSNADFFNFPAIANGPWCHIDQFSAAAQVLQFPNTGLQVNPVLFLGGTGTGALTINGTIAFVGGSGGDLDLFGPYTVTLNGVTTGTASSVGLHAGTLRVNSDLAFGTASIYFGGGTLQLINNLNIGHSIIVDTGAGTIDANGFAGTMANTALTVTGSGRLTLTNTSGTGSMTINSQLQHTGGLTVTGANNTVTLGGTNTYAGGTTVTGGATLAVDTDGRLGTAAGGITLDGGTLRLTDTAVFNTARPITLGPGGGTITNSTQPDQFGGVISGSGGLTKAGTGLIGLFAANTYTGPTVVTGGFLGLVHNQAAQNTVVTLNGGTLEFFSPATAPVLGGLAGVTNLPLAVNAMSVGNANASTTYAGNLSGSVPGGLAKVGTGTWTLTGTNTQSGPFNVQAGTVVVGSAGALSPAAPVTVSAGATLDLGGFNYAVTAADPLVVRGALRLNGAALAVAAGGTATYNGATVSNGVLRGPGTHVLTGGAALNGVTTFTSANLNQTGPASVTNFSNGGALTTAAGQTLTWDGGANTAGGQMTVNGTANVSDFVSNGLLTVPAGGSLVNTGPSGVVLGGGSTTFVGTPAAHGGVLNVGTSPLLVRGGLLVNNGAVGNNSGTGQVIVDYGGYAKGAGYWDVFPITQNGGRASSGNSPGRSQSGTFVMNGGGIYDFQINDAGPSAAFPAAPGVAGPTPDATGHVAGWSLAVVSNQLNPALSTLSVTATAADPFTINLVSLTPPTPPDTAGPMAHFDLTQPYRWLAFDVNTQGQVVNWDPSAVVINTGQLANTFTGTFGLQRDAANSFQFYVTYTPVPEPAAVLLTAFAAAVGYHRWRRRAVDSGNGRTK